MARRKSLLLLVVWPALAWAQADALLIINDWASADYANRWCVLAKRWLDKNAAAVAKSGCDRLEQCGEMTRVAAACQPDAAQDLSGFTGRLEKALAADARCGAVKFVRYDGPYTRDKAAAAAAMKPHHDLSLEYRPGGRIQAWKLIGPDYRLAEGKDEAAAIAARVCAIVGGARRPR